MSTLDNSDDRYVRRSEYEQFTKLYEIRHSELRLEIKDLESGLKSDISMMNVKLDEIKTQQARRGVDTWKLLTTALLSLIGGYVLEYVQHLFLK